MKFSSFEFFVFFIFPFLAGGVLRWLYLSPHKWVRYASFGSIGVVILWLLWDSPSADIRMGVAMFLAIVGIPALIIALIWPWLIAFIRLPYRLIRKLSDTLKGKAVTPPNGQ